MARVIRKRWASDLSAPSRRDARSCEYEAYVPDTLVGRAISLDGEVAADVADAEAALAKLNVQASSLVDTEALARLLLRAESVASSKIEGLEVGPRRLLRAEAAREFGDETSDVTATEVLGNIDAMVHGIDSVHPGDQITVDLILQIHKRLLLGSRLEEHGGQFRGVQNWIGGSDYNPCTASFIPPPHEKVKNLGRGSRGLLQRRLASSRCTGRNRSCSVRDHPPLCRWQRSHRSDSYPARPTASRSGNQN